MPPYPDPAQLAMGFRLKESKQWAEAARWFSRSAEQGHPQGMSQLALLHFHGRGVARDRVRAFHLMLQSARNGNMTAQYNVGLMYERGAGTASDVAKARQWLQRAADKGDQDARERLRSLSASSPTEGETAPGSVMWAAKRANVRAGPGTSYEKVGLLEVGEEVRVVERIGDWFKLKPRWGQPKRYVYAPLLGDTKPGM